MSAERSSTIGHERETNDKLDFRDMQEFVMVAASVSTPRPPTTERVVGLNRGPWVAAAGRADASRRCRRRDSARRAPVRRLRGRPRGAARSACRSSGSSFGTKAAFVLLADEPFVMHARTRDEALEAARKLWAVGIFDIGGYVLARRGAEQLATVDAGELKRLLDADEVQVVDVREAGERDDGYIPGSRNIPYRLLRKLAGDGLERDKPVVTICESGPRAAIAASRAAARGLRRAPGRRTAASRTSRARSSASAAAVPELRPLAQTLERVALRLERLAERRAVLLVARDDRQLDLGLPHVADQPLAVVLDRDDVPALAATSSSSLISSPGRSGMRVRTTR